MKALRAVFVLASWGVWAVAAGRADDAKTARTFEVEVVKDIAYVDGKDADPAKHKLDLYLPKGPRDFPVLFWVHGGGWRNGDRKNVEPLAQAFAKHGIGTVAISYRLSPQVRFPEHVKDVARAFAWTYKNIAKHGGRPDAIFVSGHSAGGHLASLLASDDSYLKAEKLSLSNIRGAIPVSGPQRLPFADRYKDVFGDSEENYPKASPLTHVSASQPPFLILYAGKDNEIIRTTSAELAEALKKVKVEASSVDFKDRDHGSIIRDIPKDDDPVAKAILDFIMRHAQGKAK